MMRALSYIACIFLLGLSLFCSGCLDEISLDTTSGDQILVVDGTIYNGQGPHIVRLKRSGAFVQGADGVETPVSGGSVTITEVGGPSVTLSETEPGLYETSAIQGVQGRSYILSIEVNGESYRSVAEIMPAVVDIEELDFFLETKLVNAVNSNNLIETDVVSVTATAQLPEGDEASYLKYRVSGTYEFLEMASPANLDVNFCWIDEIIDLDNLVVVDKNNLNAGQSKDQLIISKEIDYRFAFNYCFTVTQQSISEGAFNFWNKVEDEYARTGDIFESPPATLRGNVFNTVETRSDVIGVFSAIAESTSALKITSIEAGAPRPLSRPFPRPPDICFDCITIEKSSYAKPPCFD